MARSLTIKHEDKATTSPLLNGFLLLAFAWLIGSALFAAPSIPTGLDVTHDQP